MKSNGPGYWWECAETGERFKFPDITGKRSLASYFWDDLRPDWDQTKLVRPHPHDNSKVLRITYEFPRQKRKETVQLLYAVGLAASPEGYVPMLWETMPLAGDG